MLPAVRSMIGIRPICAKIAAAVAIMVVSVQLVSAMDMRVAGDQLILSGPAVGDEVARVRDILARVPGIDTIVLRNSPGGDAPTGFKLGELFRARGLRTAVSGYCYSSCSRMFLGGKSRFFTDDYPPEYTNVGFHGIYGRDGKLLPELVHRLGLKDWIIRFSDGKADPALVERWINIPTGVGMAHFYDPALYRRDGAATFLCEGPLGAGSIGKPCEPIMKTALELGVVTSLTLLHSNDQAEIRPTVPPRPRASGYAGIDDLGKLPASSTVAIGNYRRFLNFGLFPRAFAISPDGMHSGWSAGPMDAAYLALASCQRFAKRRCYLYAVDETVVWQPPQRQGNGPAP